jgi:hypothetical protein
MAEAEEQGLTAAISEAELSMPIMPHLSLSPEQLDELYPAAVPAPEVDDPDFEKDESDMILVNGLKLAGEISRDMAEFGRTRRDGDRRPGAKS